MGPLSGIATAGCIWQYNRWSSSRKRWGLIDSQLDDFVPICLDEGKKLPWNDPNDSLVDEYLGWTYRLIQVKGKIEANKENWFLVRRVNDARMGHLVVAPFYLFDEANQENEAVSKNIFVNLGWIPEDVKYDS